MRASDSGKASVRTAIAYSIRVYCRRDRIMTENGTWAWRSITETLELRSAASNGNRRHIERDWRHAM